MTPDLEGAVWRKASYSGGSGGQCVEVTKHGGVGAVRDSKNAHGPVLAFSETRLAGFVTGVRAGRFRA